MNKCGWKSIFSALNVFALIVGTPAGRATTIDFDTYASGTAITTQYQPLGVLFSSNGNSAASIYQDANTPVEAVSQPNILVGASTVSNLFLRFVDPVTGAPTTASNVSVYAISVGHNQWTVTARDLFGQQLETPFVLQNLNGPVNGLGNQDLLTFASSNIASIDFVFTVSSAIDGIGIDNLNFELQRQVPELCSTVALAGIALIGLAITRPKGMKK